ncbi:hypothetical protein QQ045_032799 [Rhodiola kirilowii]
MDCRLAEGPSYEISPWTEKTVSDDLMKDAEECKSSQAKRRRMLRFTNEAINFPLCPEELSSACLKSKVRFWLIFSEELVNWLKLEIICGEDVDLSNSNRCQFYKDLSNYEFWFLKL